MFWAYVTGTMTISWFVRLVTCFISILAAFLGMLKCLDPSRETGFLLFSHLTWPMLSTLGRSHQFVSRSSLIYAARRTMCYANTHISSWASCLWYVIHALNIVLPIISSFRCCRATFQNCLRWMIYSMWEMPFSLNALRRRQHIYLLSKTIPCIPSLIPASLISSLLSISPPTFSLLLTLYLLPTRHIEASLSSIATQINFFIHNLAQFKFQSTTSTQGLLSFSPTSYSLVTTSSTIYFLIVFNFRIATDAKVDSAVVVAYYKRFYPNKYIVSLPHLLPHPLCIDHTQVYQIQVTRVDSSLPVSNIFRRYSEFSELHGKLVECFPQDNLPQLPSKTFLPGLSTTKEVSSYLHWSEVVMYLCYCRLVRGVK